MNQSRKARMLDDDELGSIAGGFLPDQTDTSASYTVSEMNGTAVQLEPDSHSPSFVHLGYRELVSGCSSRAVTGTDGNSWIYTAMASTGTGGYILADHLERFHSR